MPRPPLAWTIGLVAGSSLVYEILLTRIAALRLAFHYSFLMVAGALLAVGVSGALLALFEGRLRGREVPALRRLAWAYALSLPATYAFLLLFPAPFDVKLVTGAGAVRFAAYVLGAAVPFLFAGGVIGLILLVEAKRVHRVYAVDLFGAALGCVACPLLLWQVGAGGALAAAVGVALLGCATLGGKGRAPAMLLALVALGLSPGLDGWFPVPSKVELELTEDISFVAGDRELTSRWSAISRVDVADVPAAERNLFMRGATVELPRPERQAFLMQDGSAGTYVHDYTNTPEGLEGLRNSLYSLAVRVLEPQSMFVIGVGGGDDLWAAKHAGVGRARGIELNRQILDLHRGLLRDYSADLVEDPAIELVHGEGRTQLLRERRNLPEGAWDLVQMSAIDTWTALQSGAYVLAENYLYTEDALDDMVAVLGPEGAVQITRFSGDHEALRLLATLRSVHARRGQGPFAACVACIPSKAYLTTLYKRRPFTTAELDRLDAFLVDSGLPVAYHPRLSIGGPVEGFIRLAEDQVQPFLASRSVDLRPVSDDRPYFFHFYRWDDFSQAKRSLDAGVTVTQGNPLFLLGQLALALLAAALILGVPWVVRRLRGGSSTAFAPALVAFACVGAGFMAIEVALMQKLVLLVGHPLYSITVTLAAMLLATGAGAYLSRRRFDGPTGAILWVPAGLAIALGLFASFDDAYVRAAVHLEFVPRMLAAGVVVVPVGLLLGIPFAHGLRLVERREPGLVPWAWAANAVFSVVGSIATVVVSMNFGFRAVFACGVALYLLAALALRRLGRGEAA